LESNSQVFSQQSGAIIGLFEIRNNNQDISIEDIELTLAKNSTAPGLSETVFLVDYHSGNIISYVNGEKFNSGPVIFSVNNLSLAARTELALALVTELPSTADNGDIYKIIFNKITYRAANGEYYYDEVGASGRSLSVSQADIYIYSNNDEDETSFIKGEDKVKIASFIIEASADADAQITAIVLAKADTSGSITYNNGFSNLKVYLGAKKIGSVIAQPYGDSFTFDGFSYKLEAGERAELKVFADIDSDLKVSQTRLKLVNLVANEYVAGTSANVNGLGTASYVVSFGEIGLELAVLSGGNVSAGADDNLVSIFKITNTGSEIVKLRYLTVETYSNAFSYSAGYSDLEIYSNETGKRIGRKSKPVAGSNRISLGSYKLGAGETAIFSVYIDASKDVPTSSFQIYFKELEAKGKNSNIDHTLSSGQSQTVSVAGGSPASNANTSVSASSTTTTTTTRQTINDEIEFVWPVDGDITYGFHDPDYPYADYFEHSGVDIEADQGTELLAAADGTVINAYNGGVSGYSYITIKHSDSLKTSYGHVSAIYVSVGERVAQGQIIGLTGGEPGTSGAGAYSNGPHLHFEVLVNNINVDPEDYLD
jgi:murein DD-endopeptidase MepM/ murein hydrolase activator NlpD